MFGSIFEVAKIDSGGAKLIFTYFVIGPVRIWFIFELIKISYANKKKLLC
jgi:hypothetical protein